MVLIDSPTTLKPAKITASKSCLLNICSRSLESLMSPLINSKFTPEDLLDSSRAVSRIR